MFAALNEPVPPEMLGGGRGGRGRRNADGANASVTPAGVPAGAQANAAKPAGASPAPPAAPAQAGEPRVQRNFGAGGGGDFGGRGGQGGFGGRGGEGGGDRQARMLDRFKTMSPDEQKQFIERIKGRGGDTSAFEKAMAPAGKGKPGAEPAATTIDALFAPLPTVERPGRAWLYVDKQLKSVTLRTGITDGTNTEIVNGDLQPGTEVVTGMILPNRGTPAAAGANGNPFQQGNRGGNRGGGFPGGGRF